MWGGRRWGVRRLLTHIENLPRDSAYVRDLQGAHAYWDESTELLASVLDSVNVLSYYLLRVNGNDADTPKPFPRPGVVAETISLSDFGSFLKG